MLPMNRLSVSIGESSGAKVGQRFLIRAPKSGTAASTAITQDERIAGRYPAMYKGEIVLVEVQDEMAFAEILHLGDVTWTVEPGDRLKIVSGEDSLFSHLDETPETSVRKDVTTKLFSFSDFVSNFSTADSTRNLSVSRSFAYSTNRRLG